jgi:hypothetical protein
MPSQPHQAESPAEAALQPDLRSNWLSRPISARTLAWLVDALIMIAGLLLFTLIFLAITHELPSWHITLGIATAAALFVAGAYWALFALFGGASLGARLAQAVSSGQEEVSEGDRFR